MPSADHDLGPQDLGAPATRVRREPPNRSPEHAEPSRFIPHVQGLRAIAVLLVVLYHFWPARLSGGYVGVDVFFVISGFLITGHLMRELQATGTVRLGQFWARRARRLLPASLLVLLFSALAVMSPYLMPTSALPNEVKEIIASTFYVENWYLAFNSADYLNHAGNPTTVQHYWSLSLEEQFYVLWPLIMLLAAWIAVKWMRGRTRTVIIAALGAVSIASFVFCVGFTLTNPAPAYFVTFGRMWEFGLGAMVALIPALRIRHAAWSFVVGWAGIIALLYTAFRFDAQTTFPGYAAALPADAPRGAFPPAEPALDALLVTTEPCWLERHDADADKVADDLDQCPATPGEAQVDAAGCPLDGDGDGVADYQDQCADTPAGVEVEPDGCPPDGDSDGVPDYKDGCADTPAAAKVGEDGCAL
ncbi:MAG: acyltransferase family protein, partial [Actinobacteria bacterium]|nr:acyltransferase family protein [Actinomycetota bacterium]